MKTRKNPRSRWSRDVLSILKALFGGKLVLLAVVAVGGLLVGGAGMWLFRDYVALKGSQAGLETQQRQVEVLAREVPRIEKETQRARERESKRTAAVVADNPQEWLARPADPLLVRAVCRLYINTDCP